MVWGWKITNFNSEIHLHSCLEFSIVIPSFSGVVIMLVPWLGLFRFSKQLGSLKIRNTTSSHVRFFTGEFFLVSENLLLGSKENFGFKILPLLGSGRTNVVNATARASYDTWRLNRWNMKTLETFVGWEKNWVSLHPEKKNAINHGSWARSYVAGFFSMLQYVVPKMFC